MIRIMSQRNVVSLLEADPPQSHHLIFISSPDDPFALKGTVGLPVLAKSFLLLGFHDISFESHTHTAPTQDAVMTALKFAEGKDDLIICCHAGISRSSATAYVISSHRSDPKEALNVLDINRHFPNLLIVKHGSAILKKPEMVELIQDFHKRAHEAQEKDLLDNTDLSHFQ